MTEFALLRAKDAREKIREILAHHPAKQNDYLSYVKALPAAILQNGLGQALATQLAADKGERDSAHYLLYRHVSDWLCGGAGENAPYDGNDVLEAMTTHGQAAYVHAQQEALAYLEWAKKFASAFLQKGDGSP